jgi:hypothetical protein
MGEMKGHTITRRNVIQYRSFMRLRPRIPREFDRISRVNGRVQSARSRALMAVYVSAAHGCGLYEANILVQSIPAGCLRAVVGGEVIPNGIGTRGPGVVDGDAGDEAVGGDRGEEGGG